MTGAEISTIIQAHRYRFENEDELQGHIEAVLLANGVDCIREVRLNDHDRADLMADKILIEVKIGTSRAGVIRQLHRYSLCDGVSEIVLVTSKSNHLGMPREMNWKPIHVASLLGGAF